MGRGASWYSVNVLDVRNRAGSTAAKVQPKPTRILERTGLHVPGTVSCGMLPWWTCLMHLFASRGRGVESLAQQISGH